MKRKQAARIISALLIALICILTITCCKRGNTPPNTDMVTVADNSSTEYVIVYSSTDKESGTLANQLKFQLYTSLGINIECVSDTADVTTHEILIGKTSRALSDELEASATKDTLSDSQIWGIGYKNGSLAIYANSKEAFDASIKHLFDNYLKNNALTVPTNLWYTHEYTKAEMEADKKAEDDAKREQYEKERLEALDNRLISVKTAIAEADFYNSQFGATEDWQTKYAMPTDIYEPERQITTEHPRIHLTKDTVPKIKALLENEEYSEMAKQFWDLADSEGFTGEFPETYHKNGERCRYSEEVLAEIEARALAYLLTGHKAYGYEAIFGIKNAMLTLLYTVEDHGDVYHGPSHVMFVLSEVYDWCYDLLTEQDKKQLISGCVYLLIEAEHFTDDDFILETNKPSVKAQNNEAPYGFEYNFPPDNMNAVAGHGTGPQFLRDYMMVTVAFADEMPTWWDYVGGRFYQEYVPVTERIYQNGYVTQGTANYGTIKVMVNLIPAYIVELATGANPFPSYLARSAEFMLSHLLPNGKMFETGDGHRTGEGVKVIHDYFYYYAAMYNDTFSLQAAKYFSKNYTEFSLDCIYTLSPTLALALCAECDKASGSFPSDLPLYTYAGYPGGQTLARNSWESDAAVVMMKIGELTNANHDHLDSGTFQIYYKGLLATTTGQYHHYGQPHHMYYHQSTVSTNGLLVYNPTYKETNDGWYSGSQTILPTPNNAERIIEWQSGKYDIGKVVGVENLSGKFSYLAGDITKAYDEKTVDYVGRRMLTVFTEHKDAPMLFFVFDSITSDSADFKKTFLLHTVKEPTLNGDASNISITPDQSGKMIAKVINGEGAMVLQSLYGADKAFKIGGEGFAYWIGNENDFDGTAASGKNLTDDYVKTDKNEPVWGRIEVVAEGEKHTDMLNVIYVTDSGNTEIVPAELIESENGKLVGAKVKDVVAMFVKDASRSSDALTFTAEGEGNMRYYVSGLYEGTWSVSVNGGAKRNVKVKSESGLLSFTAECGTVTLTPGDNIVPAGHGRIDYVMNGGILPEDAPEWYEEGVALSLPIPKHSTGYFEGWYTDADYTNKVTEIPKDAKGTYKLYAKFYTYDVYVDLNYERENEQMLLLQKDKTNGVAATASLSVDNANGCLVWNVDSGNTKVFRRNTPLISEMDVSDNSLTYVISMSKNPGVPLLKTEYQLRVADSILGTNYGYVTFMCTSNDGGVYLGSVTTNENMKIATLSDSGEVLTVKLVVDFDGAESGKATVTAFDKNNEELKSGKLSVPSKALNAGISSMLQWRDWLKTYQVWWVGYGNGERSSLRIHSIYGIEGNHVTASVPLGHGAIKYELLGGALPDDAPKSYEMGKTTELPIPTHESGKFCGWYLDTEYTQPITEISKTMTGEVVVYAKWTTIFLEEDYSDGKPAVNVSEANYNDGKINYCGNGKAGASFTVKQKSDGVSYLEWTKGESDSFINATSNVQNYSHLTGDAIVSMTFDLELIDGKPFICADAKILASSAQGGGEDCIFQIKQNGDVCLNNRADHVIGNISTDKRVVVRVAVDFKHETYTAYDGSGNVITSCAMVLPTKAKNQGFTTFDEWRINRLNLYLLYMQARVSADGAALGINSILIEEGNAFTK